MNIFKKYKKTGFALLRDPNSEDSKKTVSVSNEDLKEWNGSRHGKIAQNPDNKSDLWYVAHDAFTKFYEQTPVE